MAELKAGSKKHLRGLAHALRPAVQVGKEGLTPAVGAAVETALAANELVKVRLAGSGDARHEMAAAVAAAAGAHLITVVGFNAVLYREQADPERRRIVLP